MLMTTMRVSYSERIMMRTRDIFKVNNSYFVLQAMVIWGNDRRMEFDRDAKILRNNFVIDLLSCEDNSCRYAIPANIQQRLINIAKMD
ncbi:hypothetical protein ZEAMMB73_Zm00001d012758 [Zea mays]|uniref:Uncharacterized protein n=1 Tax=Zea mays TaxID=4577 RepID=A0A1D6GC80_MAIZE|nr:hypothetical protein ZEAMMB73_Zm00001d012758 [Zea mays]